MKLLYCSMCGDIFNLTHIDKKCSCGCVSGKYIDETHAITNGGGISLAIGNESFVDALIKLYIYRKEDENRDFYIKNCNISCWCRPNCGTGNPHTKLE